MYFDTSGHQPCCFKGFDKTMNCLNAAYRSTTPSSSAGLVYFHYGRRVPAAIMANDATWTKKILI
jgi:uncharacterized UPF0160 family protein